MPGVMRDRGLWAASLALACLYLWRLWATPLFDVDEGAFAEATRELLQSGDWWHTTLNGADRFDKPILVYWLQALSVAVGGVTEWAVRLPSALCVLGACVAVGRFAAPRWGQATGVLAAVVLGSCLGLLAIGRASTADGLLNALLVLTALQLWQFAETGRTVHARWAYFWCGLGLLAKGPVAVLVPGGALLLWSLTSDRGRTAWRAALYWPGWLIALAVAAPWYAYALHRHGMAFVNGFVLRHNVERFTGTLEGHGGGVLYYLVALPLLMLPWAPALLALLPRARRLWADPLSRFLLLWAVFVLGLFSLSGTKLPHYMLYGVAPLALLVARHLSHDAPGRGTRLALWLTLATQLVLAAALPTVVQQLAPTVPDVYVRGLLQAAPSGQHLLWATLTTAVLCLLALGWRGPTLATRFAVATVAGQLLWVGAVIPWVGQTLQSPVQQAGLWARQRSETIVQWQLDQPSFAFYRGVPAPKREPVAGELALVRQDRLQASGRAYQAVYANPHLAIVRLLPTTPAVAAPELTP